MEAKKLFSLDKLGLINTNTHNKSNTIHKSSCQRTISRLSIRSTKTPRPISLINSRPHIISTSNSPTPIKLHTKFPKIEQKTIDISQKSLKNIPARYFIPQYQENIRKHKIDQSNFDLQLLKEINFKQDKETFEENQRLMSIGLSCRQELNGAYLGKRVKRVRFQLV